MKELNDDNGASAITTKIAQTLLDGLVDDHDMLFGAEFGVAFGGGIEKIGKLWGSRGFIWGFDTFTGHPKEIAEQCPDTLREGGLKAHAAWCMDAQYEKYGTEYSLEHIRAELDKQGIHNVHLIQGLITEKTNVGFLPMLHYVLLDLDFPLSMRNAYRLIEDRMVVGGYLCLHDVIPKGHIPGCWELYQEILAEGKYELENEFPGSYLAVLRRK